jgi:hypothetical protein
MPGSSTTPLDLETGNKHLYANDESIKIVTISLFYVRFEPIRRRDRETENRASALDNNAEELISSYGCHAFYD